MSKYSKYVNLLMIFGAATIFWVARHYIVLVSGYYQLGRTFGPKVELYQWLISAALGIGTFVILKRNQKANEFTADAVHELVNVSWPNQKETRLGTIVVIVTVIIAGLVLGVLDLGLNWIVKASLGA